MGGLRYRDAVFRRKKIEFETAAVDNPETDIAWDKVPDDLRPVLDRSLDALDRWRRLVDRLDLGAGTGVPAHTTQMTTAVRGLHTHSVGLGEARPSGWSLPEDPTDQDRALGDATDRLTAVGDRIVEVVTGASDEIAAGRPAPASLAADLDIILVELAQIGRLIP